MSKIPVMLRISSRQCYQGIDPDSMELVTEGTLEKRNGVWDITYEESDLTELSGVITSFCVSDRGIALKRTGRLQSQMIFREGIRHESLYQLDFGALMIAVTAQKIRYDLSEQGGTVDIVYNIEVEQSAAGVVEYHLSVTPMN